MIDKDLVVETQIEIEATPDSVWKAIVTPSLVEKYFFGTTVRSDWKQGSSIVFSGAWDGKTFEDRGILLEILPRMRLQYTYWSSFSGLEDREENYSIVTYQLVPTDSGTQVTVSQVGFANETASDHAIDGWEQVLGGMKKLVEDGIVM